MICMQLKMFNVLQSIIIVSMIYARTTTFSIKFILGKMKFPVFSLIIIFPRNVVFGDIMFSTATQPPHRRRPPPHHRIISLLAR